MTIVRTSVIAISLTLAAMASARSAELTGAAMGDARTKVATAVALANIAEAEKDGEALLVATKMLASAGPVAMPGAAMTDGKPTLYDIPALITKAKDMGADAGKADALGKTAMPMATPTDGYWYYSCDSYNNCQWIYAGY